MTGLDRITFHPNVMSGRALHAARLARNADGVRHLLQTLEANRRRPVFERAALVHAGGNPRTAILFIDIDQWNPQRGGTAGAL